MRHLSKKSLVLGVLVAWVATAAFAPAASAKGRYKIGNGGKCYWDANDTGPNQCKPPAGRFKKEGDKCVWAADDGGPDQCKPRTGRFKKQGVNCVWAANDSGPNQCDPRVR